jgi:hypothetical protein
MEELKKHFFIIMIKEKGKKKQTFRFGSKVEWIEIEVVVV